MPKNTINLSSNIFNSAIAAYSISAACELEILDELKNQGFIDIKDFCHKKSLHLESVSAILNTLCCFEICTTTNDKNFFTPGSVFAEIYHTKGCFLWLVRGYGDMLQSLASIAENENRTGSFIKVDGKYVAMASTDQGSRFIDPYFEQVLHSMPFTNVADLGCGSGRRLVELAKQHPEVRGIGVDINHNAVSLARRSVAQFGLNERITVLQSDMRSLWARPEFSSVDTLFSFFCGHDLWPKDNCLKVMQNLRRAFPGVKRFLLCDTYRSNVVPSSNVPIFTLGFETVHAVMGQYIPSLMEWMDLFRDSGWNCVERHDVEAPFSTIFELRPV